MNAERRIIYAGLGAAVITALAVFAGPNFAAFFALIFVMSLLVIWFLED